MLHTKQESVHAFPCVLLPPARLAQQLDQLVAAVAACAVGGPSCQLEQGQVHRCPCILHGVVFPCRKGRRFSGGTRPALPGHVWCTASGFGRQSMLRAMQGVRRRAAAPGPVAGEQAGLADGQRRRKLCAEPSSFSCPSRPAGPPWPASPCWMVRSRWREASTRRADLKGGPRGWG